MGRCDVRLFTLELKELIRTYSLLQHTNIMAKMFSTFSKDHPYYPQNVAIPKYEPNESPLHVLLVSFGLLLAVVLGSSLWISKKLNPNLTFRDKFLIGWFVQCELLRLCPKPFTSVLMNYNHNYRRISPLFLRR